jgi:hypothetical protein
VPKNLFRPPEHLVKQWPEVFEDLRMNTMPVSYLEILRIEFQDGRIWEIDLRELESDQNLLADRLVSILEEYQRDIKNIRFEINVEKLKTDIKSQTKNLL